MNMKRPALTFFLTLAALTAPIAVFGQSFQNLSGQANNINLAVSPKIPGPNQFVTATIQSYGLDLDRAGITWSLNGAPQKEAVGLKTFLFKTGGLGSASNILVLVKTSDGELFQQVLNVRPSALDLIWEAQSYAPPFYRGKALYPFQGTVKVVAMPNIVTEVGEVLNPKTLVYTWKADGAPVANVSGYGKNFIFFSGSIPIKPATIEVEAVSVDQKYRAAGKIDLSPRSPRIVFYEDNPLYGILYSKALRDGVILQNSEIKLAGIPYFIGAKARDGEELSYEWQLNDRPVGNEAKSALSFRQNSGLSGIAAVSLKISNPSKIFQFASNTLSLTLGKTSAANLFGTP